MQIRRDRKIGSVSVMFSLSFRRVSRHLARSAPFLLALVVAPACADLSNEVENPGSTGTGGSISGASGGASSGGSGTGANNTGGFGASVSTGGSSNGGNSTGGSSTGGASTGGASTGGASTGGASTGGASTGGASTGGASTGGASTGGNMGMGGASAACALPYISGSHYIVGDQVSMDSGNWECNDANCRNSICSPGVNCAWGETWTNLGACY